MGPEKRQSPKFKKPLPPAPWPPRGPKNKCVLKLCHQAPPRLIWPRSLGQKGLIHGQSQWAWEAQAVGQGSCGTPLGCAHGGQVPSWQQQELQGPAGAVWGAAAPLKTLAYSARCHAQCIFDCEGLRVSKPTQLSGAATCGLSLRLGRGSSTAWGVGGGPTGWRVSGAGPLPHLTQP